MFTKPPRKSHFSRAVLICIFFAASLSACGGGGSDSDSGSSGFTVGVKGF